MNKTVVIGITGGIAAYKILDLIKLLKKKGMKVIVIMTYGATKIIDPEKLEKITGNKVYINIFEQNVDYQRVLNRRQVDHIELAKKADLILIAPATANSIAKIANGIADDYVTTTVLAARTLVMICPSMNAYMWNNPATQKNIEKLHSLGYIILDPDSGMLACGDEGEGRLVAVEEIAKEISRVLYKAKKLQGKKVIVTAGGTVENIDNVRFIANKSSGKMGIAIAETCYLQGAEVLLIRSKSSVRPRYPLEEKIFETAEELEKILQETTPNYDICFHVAAVSDFSVKNSFNGKMPSDSEITLLLIPREKILNKIKQYNQKITLIGFKAAWNVSEKDLIDEAKKKLHESNADFIVVNDVGKKEQGFQSDKNEVYMVSTDGNVTKIPLNYKRIVAEKIIDQLL